MKRITKISLIVAGAVLVVSSFSGCAHFRSPENRAQWMVEKVTDKLELTEPQQSKLQTLSDEMLSTRKTMKQQFGETREQMVTLFDQPTLDQDRALTIVQTHTQLVDERAAVVVAAFADFYDVLNSEQQTKIREFMQEHDDHRSHWGYRGFFRHH